MPIAYLCLIILAFIFSQLHWPFANLLVVLGSLMLLVDILVQFIRTLIKKTHFSTLLGAIALTFLSVGYLFTWMFWAGTLYVSWFTLIVSATYFIYWLIAKRKITVRFSVTAFVFLALLSVSLMKPSTRLCVKNGMDRDNPKAPVFIRHRLAWYINREGDPVAAKRILENELTEVSEKMKTNRSAYYREVFKQDSAIISNALNELNNGGWKNYVRLVPESI